MEGKSVRTMDEGWGGRSDPVSKAAGLVPVCIQNAAYNDRASSQCYPMRCLEHWIVARAALAGTLRLCPLHDLGRLRNFAINHV